MSISPEDVRVELKLKHTHIIQLFDALRGDGQFCHRLLSTLAIVELINKVFELESHSLVLECKELEEALKRIGVQATEWPPIRNWLIVKASISWNIRLK